MARPKAGYVLADGTPVPGVTTLINELAKPALIGWAGKTVAEEAARYGTACWHAGVAQKPAPAFPKWGEILYGIRDQAAADGTVAHNLFEHYLRTGLEPDRDGITDSAWQAYENAQQWLGESALNIEPHERPMVSERWGYGGTPDAIARKNGAVYLADWKTGGIYDTHLIQMAAYAALLKEVDGIEVEGVRLVRFHREHADFHSHSWSRDVLEDGWRVFKALLDLREPLARLKKRCR